MTAGFGDKFEADPAKLRAFIEGTRQLGQHIEQIRRTFEHDEKSTAMWPGIDDDYAKQAGGRAKKERDMVLKALEDISVTYNGIVDGYLEQLRTMTGLQGDVMDSINQMKSFTEGIGDADKGKSGR
ncbi:hypothetical protein ACIP29_27595 [Streptomyces coelicoflavus]|uniref:hypothetical protein n=1 Tax=Streptomyces coelicoflavus TaxID=285562 RepID=UPI0037FBFDC6